MMFPRETCRFVLVAAMVVLVSGCGGGRRQAVPPTSVDLSTGGAVLAAVQAELDALPTPEGVDEALFARLKQALAEALANREGGLSSTEGKVVATPPRGPKNQIDDLALTQQGTVSGDLSWSYRNSGDYNQDSLVTILDVTPLAVHFNESVEGGAPVNEVIDGNGDGVISILDVTPLAAGFGVELADCAVEGTNVEGGANEDFTEVGSADLTSATGEGRKRLTYHLGSLDYLYYRVVPRDSLGERGDPSNVVAVITEAQAPTVNSVSPLKGLPNAEVTFTANVSGTPPFEYSWDFGGGAEPNTSTDEAPEVKLGTVGSYSCVVTVSNFLGEDRFDFQLSVSGVPHIESLSPQAGATGAQVTLTAVVTGATPITYEWDFGGGASPDTPVTAEPQVEVTLLAPGQYPASLTAQNSYGSHVYPFFLRVGLPPMIMSVLPAGGVTGKAVVFSVAVQGTSPFDYEWDFGDGATPSASVQPTPSVLLGEVGTYDGSVRVTSDFGEDDFEFSYEVTPPPPEPNITGVSPTGGLPHTEVTFSATVEGEAPFTYAWDFGLGATPDTSDEPSPTVELYEEGNYDAELRVDNAYGTDTYEFVLRVNYAGVYDEMENNDNRAQANSLPAPPLEGFKGNLGPGGYDGDATDYFSFTGPAEYMLTATLRFDSGEANLDLELLDSGGTRLARSNGTGDTEYVEKVLPVSGTFYLHATRASGGNADYTLDYDVREVQLWPSVIVAGTSLGEGNASGCTSMAIVGGKPAIAYYSISGETGDLKFAINSEADASGSWTKSDIDTSDDSGREPSLAEVNGKPAVSYYWLVPMSMTDLGIKIAVNSEANGSGSWSPRTTVDGTAGPPSSIAKVNDTLAVAYCLPAGNARFAINAQPDGSGAWTRNTIETGGFKAISLAVIGGKPAVAYVGDNGFTVRFAVNTQVDGSGAWNAHTVESVPTSVFNGVSLTEIDGRPAIAYTEGVDRLLRFAINELVDGSGSWNPVTVGAPHFTDVVSLRVIRGLPSIAANNTLGYDLRFLQNSAADASGEWVEEVVDNTGTVGWSCSLAEVAGKPGSLMATMPTAT